MKNQPSLLQRAAAIRQDAEELSHHPLERDKLFELASAAATLAEEACEPLLLMLHIPKPCVDHMRQNAKEAGITLNQAYTLLATGKWDLWDNAEIVTRLLDDIKEQAEVERAVARERERGNSLDAGANEMPAKKLAPLSGLPQPAIA